MMAKALLWAGAIALSLAAASAHAQSSGQPDNAALLRAIEGLSGQLKTVTGRIDRLEERDRRRGASAGEGATPAASSKPVAPPAKAVPGWFVRLIPWNQDGGGDPIGGFPGPLFDFNFDMHTRYVGDNNRYIYNGIGIFNVKEDGVYVFSMVLEPVLAGDPLNIWSALWFNCTGDFYVGGNRLFGGTTSFGGQQRPERDVYRSQSFYGQIRLTPGTHKVEFKTDCGINTDKNHTSFDKWLPVYKRNRFKVMVKSPADPNGRPFLPQELYYVGQAN